MSTWLTARELAGLPGMPSSERRTRDKLTAMQVPSRYQRSRDRAKALTREVHVHVLEHHKSRKSSTTGATA